MDFGVPKEVRDHQSEMRVGLTPAGVKALVRAGHTVYVEKDAGQGAGFKDELYREYGAHTVYSAAELYGRADVIVKVARPAQQEHRHFRPGQTIFSFLHLQVASPDLFQALAEKEITAVAMEMIRDENGCLPVLQPMSEIAGRLAPIIAGQMLMTIQGGRGTLLGGIPGVTRGSVVILGAGVLGTNAARAFLGLGAQVMVVDRSIRQLVHVDELLDGRVTTLLATEHNLDRISEFADVLVGAIQVSGRRAEQLVTRDMVRRMRPGSVIIDYAIDDGGCVATSRPTTLNDPVFTVDEVLHYCVPNATASVARTTSYGLTNALLPYLLELGAFGMMGLLDRRPGFEQGINLYQGQLTNAEVAAALGRSVSAATPLGGA